MLMVGIILQILTVAFVLDGNKTQPNQMSILSLFDDGGLIRKVIPANQLCDSPSILALCRVDGMVILWVVNLNGRVLLSSNSCNTVDNTCHNNVTNPLWGQPELTQALELGFEHAYGHRNPECSPAVGQIKNVFGALGQGQGKGSTERAGMDILYAPGGGHQTLL